MANEKRLIDAKDACKYAKKQYRDGKFTYEEYDAVIETINNTNTVDAVEVVHGRWIPLEYDGYADGNPVWDLWECSECQEEHSGDEDTLTPYCPHCGAKMDGGNEDANKD